MTLPNYSAIISKIQSQIDSASGVDITWNQLNTGRYNLLAIKTDGTLWTWGISGKGQLGDGSYTSRSSPGTVAGGGTNWSQVSSGFEHVAAIKTDGTLWTWGYNIAGQLGDNTPNIRRSPGTVAGGGTTWCQVVGSLRFTAAIKTDGTLWTWGTNYSGVLGDGTTVSRCSPGTTWGSYTNWCKVFGGNSSTLAIKTDGTLWTWGSNGQGRLGDGTTIARCSPGTIAGGGTTWCDVDNASRHNVAIKTDGTLWSWGCNGCGRLGDGTTINKSSPGTIWGGGTTWCQVSGGDCHNIAIKTDGTLWTWGNNDGGKLGDGTTVNRCSPGTIFDGGTTWSQVFGFCNQTAAIKTDGTLWSWGYNGFGQLGDGTTVNRCSPGSVPIQTATTSKEFTLLSAAVACIAENRQVSVASTNNLPELYQCGNRIANGSIIFAEDINAPVISKNECWIGLDGRVLRSDAPTRTLWTWGQNVYGNLGDGTTVARCSPGTVAGDGTTWCKIAANIKNGIGIKTDGTIWTWGCNFNGQLGDGTTVSRSSPGTIWGGDTTWCDIGMAFCTIGAIKTDGTLWTWGFGSQLGNNSNINRCSPGTIADGGTTWCQVRGTSNSLMGLKIDGTLWTWGCNSHGQLGDGTTVNRSSPVTIINGGTTWCQISGGGSRVAAIKTDGTLWTWGCNPSGSLGDGTTVSRCSPGTVVGDDGTWSQVTISGNISAAIKTDGTLWTWGNNASGELGTGLGFGSLTNRCSPGTTIGSATTWCLVKSYPNASHFLASKTDGTLWAWGNNGCGELGNGTTVDRCSPSLILDGNSKWFDIFATSCGSLAIELE